MPALTGMAGASRYDPDPAAHQQADAAFALGTFRHPRIIHGLALLEFLTAFFTLIFIYRHNNLLAYIY